MSPDDALGAKLSLSALGGAALWGMLHLVTTLLSGQPVHRQDLILAGVNVACALIAGVLVAYFVGPSLIPMIPIAGLRDPQAVGFGIGAVSWEFAPLAYRWARLAAVRKAGGAS